MTRSSEFIFLARGYLSNLELENRFYERASQIGSEYDKRVGAESTIIDAAFDRKSRPNWIHRKDRIRTETNIGDFGLFEIVGTWLGSSSLRDPKIITKAFQRELDQLEPDREAVGRPILDLENHQ